MIKFNKNIFSVIFLFMLVTNSFSFANEFQQDDIVGVWLIEEKGEPCEKIEIYNCGDSYFGKIVWIKSSDTTAQSLLDEKNKNKKLRNRQLHNLEVLKGYKFDGKDSWKGGKFYAHRKGKTVSPRLTLLDKDHLQIQVKFLFVKKSIVLERVPSN